ncbi:sigma factor [Streptomyces sp. KAU_LT]|uniref:sigma factor n=1 Tax=Streptomyces sp. KAU_LT TaxID=3046669 RepID=UPI0024B79D67|nr:sigma factor [Streptomyces sp. KAU_LT]MDI9835741.1 sigma factor [Streptomyces sp. KAU_LT]
MSAPTPETTTPAGTSAARPAEGDMDTALDVFLTQRKRLLRLAHRIVGDVSAAEDVVQEAWVRWQLADRTDVENPAGFLTTTTTRLAINVVQSGRRRHETPSEPRFADLGDHATSDDPMLRAERTAAIESALALLMARLTPDRLAAYVLRKGFDYSYAELAKVLRTSAPNARVVVHRAQARLDSGRERPIRTESHRRLVAAFRTAADTGDLDDLLRLLVPEQRVHRLTPPSRGPAGPEHFPLRHAA